VSHRPSAVWLRFKISRFKHSLPLLLHAASPTFSAFLLSILTILHYSTMDAVSRRGSVVVWPGRLAVGAFRLPSGSLITLLTYCSRCRWPRAWWAERASVGRRSRATQAPGKARGERRGLLGVREPRADRSAASPGTARRATEGFRVLRHRRDRRTDSESNCRPTGPIASADIHRDAAHAVTFVHARLYQKPEKSHATPATVLPTTTGPPTTTTDCPPIHTSPLHDARDQANQPLLTFTLGA
jgi:hypothetical protein